MGLSERLQDWAFREVADVKQAKVPCAILFCFGLLLGGTMMNWFHNERFAVLEGRLASTSAGVVQVGHTGWRGWIATPVIPLLGVGGLFVVVVVLLLLALSRTRNLGLMATDGALLQAPGATTVKRARDSMQAAPLVDTVSAPNIKWSVDAGKSVMLTIENEDGPFILKAEAKLVSAKFTSDNRQIVIDQQGWYEYHPRHVAGNGTSAFKISEVNTHYAAIPTIYVYGEGLGAIQTLGGGRSCDLTVDFKLQAQSKYQGADIHRSQPLSVSVLIHFEASEARFTASLVATTEHPGAKVARLGERVAALKRDGAQTHEIEEAVSGLKAAIATSPAAQPEIIDLVWLHKTTSALNLNAVTQVPSGVKGVRVFLLRLERKVSDRFSAQHDFHDMPEVELHAPKAVFPGEVGEVRFLRNAVDSGLRFTGLTPDERRITLHGEWKAWFRIEAEDRKREVALCFYWAGVDLRPYPCNEIVAATGRG